MANVVIKPLTGDALQSILPHLARLRIQIFREWPYLYEGSEEYEQDYLAKFTTAKGAVCVVAEENGKIIGASTACPLIETDEEFITPFKNAGYDITKIFYCGESVLLPEYRGQGIGHRFFDEREAHAAKLGNFTLSTFCRVIRPTNHPQKPLDYSPLDPFWQKRGYTPAPNLIAHYPWQDVGETAETEKPLEFWLKKLA